MNRASRSWRSMPARTSFSTNSPAEALKLAIENPGSIDLLVTDVVMPGINGPDLRDRLHAAGLQDLGAVTLVESAFETHLEIRDHLAIEDLGEADDAALAGDLADFDLRKQEEAAHRAPEYVQVGYEVFDRDNPADGNSRSRLSGDVPQMGLAAR